jgi:hypothetical protein
LYFFEGKGMSEFGLILGVGGEEWTFGYAG